MKSYFRILSALSAVATVIAFSGCGGKEQEQPKPDSVKVSGVSIDKPTLSMTEGETANLTAIVMPENATNKAVAWKSGNSGVADVDASGKVTAVKAGTSDITVTTADGGKTATCKVTVASKAVPATGLTLSLSSVAFVEGQTKSINATVTPSNSTDEVVWSDHYLFENKGGGLAFSARVVTYEYKYVGIEIEALQDNEGEFFSVGIDGSGGLKKSFYVYEEK